MNPHADKKAPGCTRRRLYRVERSAVCFIKFIFEGYDGIAQVETIDPYTACIALHVPPGCEADVDAVIADLSAEYRIEAAEENVLDT